MLGAAAKCHGCHGWLGTGHVQCAWSLVSVMYVPGRLEMCGWGLLNCVCLSLGVGSVEAYKPHTPLYFKPYHPGELDVRGRSDFSRFDRHPERPHFSNFGPPAEGACGRHQFSSLLSSLSAHLGQSHGFPTGQQWAAALKSTQPTPHCGLLSSSPRGSTTALPAAAAELRHGGEGPPRPWGRAEVLPRSPILELMLRPERMRAAHSAVARHMASGAGLAAA